MDVENGVSGEQPTTSFDRYIITLNQSVVKNYYRNAIETWIKKCFSKKELYFPMPVNVFTSKTEQNAGGKSMDVENGVKETQCTNCTHRKVCAHKGTMMIAIKAVDSLHIGVPIPGSDGLTNPTPIHDVEFLEHLEPRCRYYVSSKKERISFQ